MSNQFRKILSLLVGILIYYMLLLLAVPLSYPIYLIAIGDGTILGHVTNNQELLSAVLKIPLMFTWAIILVFLITFFTVQIIERKIQVKYKYNWLLIGFFVTLMFSKSIYPYNKLLFIALCLFGMLGAYIGFKRNKILKTTDNNEAFEQSR